MKKKNRITDSKIEWIVFAFYSVSLAIVSFFHEPWFDEAQAWQIAKCASLKDILFVLPHYEGHPALWHLMLFPFARLGAPYELSLAFLAFVAISLSAWLLLFMSPFPLIVRCLLPFHYFIFYQNGVISRPYSYVTLAFFLLAIFFEERDEKPLRFVLTLGFLCMLSGFGIVLAGGIACVWLLEILGRHQGKVLDATFWQEKSVRALAMLLIIALLIIAQILPDPNAYAIQAKSIGQIGSNLLYSFFLMISDGTILAEVSSYAGNPVLFFLYLSLGLLTWAFFILLSTRKNIGYLIVPFVFFSVFSSTVYFGSHHLPIVISFLIFWLWIAFQDQGKRRMLRTWFQNLKLSEKDAMALKAFGKIVALIPVCIPVLWTVAASWHEIKYDYYFSRNTAAFIKAHGLENASFLSEWGEVIDEEWTEEEFFERINANGLYVGVDPVAFLPYFDHNFCMNLNGGEDRKAYSIHKVASAEESREIFRQLKEAGPPDALLGLIDLSEIYGEEVSNADYVPVYKITPRFVRIWKHFLRYEDSFKSRYIYVRKDLLEQYGLERITE